LLHVVVVGHFSRVLCFPLNDVAILSVSVIIPAYNNQETIGHVLDSLLSQNYEIGQVEIIVVNDCSNDNTAEEIKKFPVTYVLNKTNLGLAKSLNYGISISRFDIIVTLHADVVPGNPSWLKELVSPLADSNTAATCSVQLSPSFDHRLKTVWEKLLYGKQSRHLALNDKADAYNKSELMQIGMFDDKTFRTAGEDEDLSLRLTMEGKKIRGTNAEVTHNHYFSNNGNGVLKKILKREFHFGMAGGALRRKFPLYTPRSYLFPEQALPTTDGLFRAALCLGALIPYAQIAFIPLLFIAAFKGINRLDREKKLPILYPFFNVARFAIYTIGYIVGLAKGKQE
jgi:glycosyltransferase involved in cell wall biosynthesis